MQLTGIIVDEVCEVLDIESGQIEPAPAMGGDVSTEMILGVGKVADKVVLLLDGARVMQFEQNGDPARAAQSELSLETA